MKTILEQHQLAEKRALESLTTMVSEALRRDVDGADSTWVRPAIATKHKRLCRHLNTKTSKKSIAVDFVTPLASLEIRHEPIFCPMTPGGSRGGGR